MTQAGATENPFDRGYWHSEDLRRFGFAAIGDNVQISKNCTIIGREAISIGNNVRIDDYVLITTNGGTITIGNHIHIGAMSYLAGRGGITLEDFCNLSQGVRLYSASDDYSGNALTNPTVPDEYLALEVGAVHIGRHVVLGSGTIVLQGSTIGEGAATGALTLVKKSLEGWTIYAGAPARAIKSRAKKILELEADFLAKR